MDKREELPFDAFSRQRKAFLGDTAVTILPSGMEARKQHGMGYGGGLVRLTPRQLRALQDGKQLAIWVMDEYVVFLEGPKGG